MATLTSRERVRRALNHQETDRIPIDIGGIYNLTTFHRDAYANLQKFLGYNDKVVITSTLSQSVLPSEKIRKRFKADCYPIYIPPDNIELNPHKEKDGSTWYVDKWGVKWKCPANGLYYDPVDHPLEGCTIDEIDRFFCSNPFDISKLIGLKDRAKNIYENTDYALIINGPFDGGIYVPCQWFMGYEEFLIKMITDSKFIKAILEKVVEYHISQWDLILNEVADYAEAVVLSDDLGIQDSPLIRPSLYRELIKPAHKKVVKFIKSKTDLKIIYHCDGAVYDFIPDFIELGYDAWNPVQVSADGIDDTALLKKKFGDKLCFWGAGCESQTILSRKTPEEIRTEVKRRINDLAHGGGLVLSSIHNIQRDVPVENMIAFYDALYEYSSKFYG